ncbi:hypothetical protein [Williamsia deligens]|uniref:Minor tail protein n=1 Tax=Williamsia deligens TaxID=321325 RepID=A0ABW3GBY7_9NOCA|nr:hypothetical protein [Williamsia deligens]MCP2196314.1 hypothetical protein [Williamsia deligens]
MSVYDLATVEIVAPEETVCVSGGGFEHRAIKLSTDPEGVFSDELDLKIIETAFAPGGIAGQEDFPVRTLVLPFNLRDDGNGIEHTISRFRKLWRTGRTLLWRVTTEYSGVRWIVIKRSKGIKFSTPQDWNLDGYVRAEVTAVALFPYYESQPMEITATLTQAGSKTFWFPVHNPTDQKGWPEWSLKPVGGPAVFTFPDLSFGNEQEIDHEWAPGQFASRAIVTPPISVMWSVMSYPLMDTYVAADLSNAPGQMGANEPLFYIPPYTGTPDDPILMPVTINGPAGSQVKMVLRRHWSAESGLE